MSRTWTRVLRAASLALALFAVAGPARADGRAKRLTELARQAYARGDAATACALLEQATQDLDEVQKHVGRGACHEMEGRLVEARAAYLAAGARASADAPIAQSIQAQVAGLERRLAAIDVERSAVAPRAATARIDGEPLGPTRTFRAPGPVTVTYEAPGFERETFTITLRPGERRTLVVGALRPRAPTLAAGPAPRVEGSPVMRGAGYAFVTTGIAAVVVGGASAALTYDRARTVAAECDDAGNCSRLGYDAARSGALFSRVSTVTLPAGAGAIALGAALLYFGRSRAVRGSVGLGTAAVEGSF